MRKNIKLFIAGKEVDCSEGISLPMTYTVEDFKNPTIVKNSFSKTISIPGTKNNNKIFGEIYKLDRLQHIEEGKYSGIDFNPSKRVDFGIYDNADLIESGYIQLNTIQISKKVITYNITLYGGLGDFFYGLKYKEDGTLRTLADLQYFITDADGNVLPEETEMDFRINKDFVERCFNTDWDADWSDIYHYVTFTPAYNGLYENFDNETCLINTNGDTLFPKQITEGGVDYTPYNGYALAQLNRAYTEWEFKDLRSYMQRPALKLSKLIETICRKENSGYDVIFDDKFFNLENPYWNKTFVALPLLGSSEESENESVKENAQLIKQDDSWWIGLKPDGTSAPYNWGLTSVKGSTVITPGEGNIIDLSKTPSNTLLNVQLDCQLFFHTNTDVASNNLYLSYLRNGKYGNNVYINYPYRTSITAQILLYDADNLDPFQKPIGYSPLYNFTNKIRGVQSGPDNWFNYTPLTDAPMETVFGKFVKDAGDRYYFQSDTGNNTFRFVAKDIQKVNRVRISVNIVRETEGMYSDEVWTLDNMHPGAVKNNTVNGWAEILFDDSQYSLTASWPTAITSDVLITKKKMLKTEATPADYLLGYTKIFGLYFVKDIDSKTIRIYTRNNFFKNQINDWSKRIDYSKDFSVNPLLFDKKWYTMKQDTPETYYAKKYDKEYDIVYGQQRLDTGYNFNSDNTDLFTDNLYQNVISVRDVDQFYRNYFNSNKTPIPCFMNDNITYQLFKRTPTELKTTDKDLYGVNYIDQSKTTEWWTVPGNDVFPKTCFFTLDSDEKSLEEIKSTLLFYNGRIEMQDIKGNPINYWITDDVPEMSTLNDSESCFLYTNSETDSMGKKIAIKVSKLPQFLRFTTSSDYVVSSLDFGLPREIYIDDISYKDNSVIYSQFWKNFYNDQFDVNTKKVTCFVKLNDLQVNYDLLRQFYYFEDSYWILNKIDAYDVNSDKTTRCEFIRIQNIDSYLNGLSKLGIYIDPSESEVELDYKAGNKIITVDSNVPWVVDNYSSNITGVTPTKGLPGVTTLNISYTENTNFIQNVFALSMVPKDDPLTSTNKAQIFFYQNPNPEYSVKLSGKVTDKYGNPIPNTQILAQSESFIDSMYCDEKTGDYTLFVEKGYKFTLEVTVDGELKYTEDLTLNEDTIKNIVI